jgi:putative hemolysin
MSDQTQQRAPDARGPQQILSRQRRAPDWLRLAALTSPGLARLARLCGEAGRLAEPFAVAARALEALEVTLELAATSERHIPAAGAVVIVANHPFGGLDGLAAITTVGRRRHDLRILANPGLANLEGIGALVIPVDPFGGVRARRGNGKALRTAFRWLAAGGALLVFPAGEVSSLDLRTLSVTDRPWSATAARLVRLSGASVVPMHFAGANGALFQLAGLVHPRLRTLLLPQQLGNKIGARIAVRIGEPIAATKLAAFTDDEELAAHLRLRTYVLGHDPAQDPAPQRSAAPRRLAPLIEPVDPAILARELASLPAGSLLLEAGALRVYCAPAPCLPSTLLELGRLRELTFRAVGEGSGRSADLDAFDEHYEHLFIWNAESREIVGAYRLGRTDLISRRLGRRGLYTFTLFEYPELFLKLLGPALELGRSFVRAEYQKSFAPLLLLWRGIGEYVSRHPHCPRLLGAVSISNDYCALSRELLVGFLRARNFDPLASAMVRARQPFRGTFSLRSLGGAAQPDDLEALSALLGRIESDGKGAPVLLRQYLRLGGRILGFNIDPDFGHTLDCLVLVDLRRTDPAALRKYMTAAAWERFAARHPRLRTARTVRVPSA